MAQKQLMLQNLCLGVFQDTLAWIWHWQIIGQATDAKKMLSKDLARVK
jgi:hypothetical protein